MDPNGAVPMSVISGFARCLFSSSPAFRDPPFPHASPHFSSTQSLGHLAMRMPRDSHLIHLQGQGLSPAAGFGSRMGGNVRIGYGHLGTLFHRPFCAATPAPPPPLSPLPPTFATPDPPPGITMQRTVKASSGMLSRLDGGALPELRLAGNKRKGGSGGAAASSEILINMPDRDPDRRVSQSPPLPLPPPLLSQMPLFTMHGGAASHSWSCSPHRCIFVGGLPQEATEILVYELFTQVGPVDRVSIPRSEGVDTHKGFAFVQFAHGPVNSAEHSVNYAVKLRDLSLLHHFHSRASPPPYCPVP